MIPLLWGQRQAHSPSAGTAESQMLSPLSWGIGRAATLLKTLLQYYGKLLPGVAYPGVRDNRSTVNTKTRYKKIIILGVYCMGSGYWSKGQLGSDSHKVEVIFTLYVNVKRGNYFEVCY